MQGLRQWLRPPRNLLILFLAVVALPAAILVVLGIRLLEQDRALARQRQTEILERAGDRAVSALQQNLALWTKRLGEQSLVPAELSEDSVYVLLRAGLLQATPPGRLAYFPFAATLKEVPAEPFRELESREFKSQDLAQALEYSRKLAAAPDTILQAGALLRQARILRKLGRPNEALSVYRTLGQFTSVAISGHPADLLARRSRCALLEELARRHELRQEAAAIAADLRAGRWQLDRASYLHVSAQLEHWLGSEGHASPQTEALAAAVASLYQRWTSTPPDEFSPTGIQLLSLDGVPVTILWTSGGGRLAAFIAGPKYLEKHWLAEVQQAARPANVYLLGTGGKSVAGESPPPDARKVQRAAADTGLPWTVVVTGAAPAEEYSALEARRRTLLAAFGAVLLLISAGSYFIWRSLNREMAVARLQSEFVSDVSHEFRTPLTALRQFNELLEEDETLTADKRRSYHQAQARATERLQRFVESLLDFGRMEAGRRPYRFERIDAAVLAQDVVADFRKEVEKHGFSVRCRVDSAQYLVDADSEALAHALWNLLDNASKYSGNEREIEMTVSRAGNEVKIAVCDHGIGFPAAERKLIFQKFVRGTAAKSLGVKGTGIGLAMVEHVISSHGGRVDVASSPGRGSTFTIVLPVKE